MENKIFTSGTVECTFSYGKCGFIHSILGKSYYFSPESFKYESERLKKGQNVTFVTSERNGKPMAIEIETE